MTVTGGKHHLGNQLHGQLDPTQIGGICIPPMNPWRTGFYMEYKNCVFRVFIGGHSPLYLGHPKTFLKRGVERICQPSEYRCPTTRPPVGPPILVSADVETFRVYFNQSIQQAITHNALQVLHCNVTGTCYLHIQFWPSAENT